MLVSDDSVSLKEQFKCSISDAGHEFDVSCVIVIVLWVYYCIGKLSYGNGMDSSVFVNEVENVLVDRFISDFSVLDTGD